MSILEVLRLKCRNKVFIPLTCKSRKRKLINKNFTIISNNCWAGGVYEAHDLQKQSPTVGLFFMSEDYIKFISDLRGYLQEDIKFINPDKSKWKQDVCVYNRYGKYPIGVLRDIEIHFLHYQNEQEAKEKWERRILRINYDHLLIKFNDQNGCTQKDVEMFCQLPYDHKIFFTCKIWNIDSDVIKLIPQHGSKKNILASYEPLGKTKSIDITKIINSL